MGNIFSEVPCSLRIFSRILSIPHGIVMNLNDVMNSPQFEFPRLLKVPIPNLEINFFTKKTQDPYNENQCL